MTDIEAVAEYDTKGTRLTCVTLADGDVSDPKPTHGKRRYDEDDSSDQDEVNDFDEMDSNEEEEEEEEVEEVEED